MPSNVIEYIRHVEDGTFFTFVSSWALTSPDMTIWGPTITTGGIVSFTSGAVTGSAPKILGLDGLAWTPSISNGGVVTLTSGAAIASSDSMATLIDSASTEWILFVDLNQQLNVTTDFGISALFRFPSLMVQWIPTAGTDTFVLHSARIDGAIRHLRA